MHNTKRKVRKRTRNSALKYAAYVLQQRNQTPTKGKGMRYKLRHLEPSDGRALFEFYFTGLSKTDRKYFGQPYPLFLQPLKTVKELRQRIKKWQLENDWYFFLLYAGEKIVGCSMLKRCSTSRPVTGIAIHKKYRRQGLGMILQRVIINAARNIGLKRIWAAAHDDNIASLRMHTKCGYKTTGKVMLKQSHREIEMKMEL